MTCNCIKAFSITSCIQHYADKEKKLWEDFRHGIIIGTKEFVERIRFKYMPEEIHKEIPQQRSLGRNIAPEQVLETAAGVLNCDLEVIRHSRRMPKSMKNDRDVLVYLVWKTCRLPNEETGRLFGMTYSAISHILTEVHGFRCQKWPISPIWQHEP